MTIAQALDAAAAEHADRPFVITDARTYTYGEIQAWSRRLAAGPDRLGVGRGDHVAMVLANHPEFVAVKFAIARAGAVTVPINYLLRRQRAAATCSASRSHGADHDGPLPGPGLPGGRSTRSPRVGDPAAAQACPGLHQVFVLDAQTRARAGARPRATSSGRRHRSATRSWRDARPRRPALGSDVLYTSGTTGSPRA